MLHLGDYNEKAFMDIRTYEEMYSWARVVFTDGLLPSEYYDGTEIPREKKRVAYYNRIVGGVRMRQVRVTPNAGCTIKANVITNFFPTTGPDEGQERVRKYVEQCFSLYNKETWSRKPFGPMKQEASNSTGPEHCRPLADIDYSDARIVGGEFRYDSYEICLGKALYDTGSLVDQDTGLANVTDPLKLAFTWRTAVENDLPGYAFAGRFASYDGSGYVYDLTNLTTSNLVNAFDYLEEQTWLDRSTRAFFISLVVYNANFNLYVVVNFRFEISLAGLLIPTYTIRTVEMDLFVSSTDTSDKLIKLAIEGILYLGMVYYLSNEFSELYSIYDATGSIKGYVTDFWNIIDWGLIGLSFFALAQRIAFTLLPSVRNFSPFASEYVEISAPAAQFNESFAFDAIAASFGIFKIFRYFELQRNLFILRESITRGISDLVVFTSILMIMIMGFAFSGMNIFGQENDEYVSAPISFVTLFLTMLGEFDFDKMLRVDLTFAYFFFLVYQVFIFLIMLNVFLAILNDAYVDIKVQYSNVEVDDGPPPPTIRQRIQHLRTYLRQRQLDKRIEFLRKQQRVKELQEKRSNRKVEEARARTLKGMGIDPNAKPAGEKTANGAGNASAALPDDDSGL